MDKQELKEYLNRVKHTFDVDYQKSSDCGNLRDAKIESVLRYVVNTLIECLDETD